MERARFRGVEGEGEIETVIGIGGDLECELFQVYIQNVLEDFRASCREKLTLFP